MVKNIHQLGNLNLNCKYALPQKKENIEMTIPWLLQLHVYELAFQQAISDLQIYQYYRV